jgi:hypothetical protein
VHRVAVDARHVGAGTERQQVAPDAAAQVEDATGEPLRPVPSDRLRRRLLEAGAGEQHPVGAAELRRRALAQRSLRERCRDEVGGPRLAQPLRRAQVAVRVGRCGEQLGRGDQVRDEVAYRNASG